MARLGCKLETMRAHRHLMQLLGTKCRPERAKRDQRRRMRTRRTCGRRRSLLLEAAKQPQVGQQKSTCPRSARPTTPFSSSCTRCADRLVVDKVFTVGAHPVGVYIPSKVCAAVRSSTLQAAVGPEQRHELTKAEIMARAEESGLASRSVYGEGAWTRCCGGRAHP